MLFPVKKLPSINSADNYLVSTPQTSEASTTSSYPLLLKFHNLGESATGFSSPCYLVENCQPSSESSNDCTTFDWDSDFNFYSRFLEFNDLTNSVIMSEHEQVAEMGLIGLVNMENSCFLNSILQCLRFTFPLLLYAINKEYVHDMTADNPQLVEVFCKLVTKMWNSSINNNSIAPVSFIRAMQEYSSEFDGRTQQDAHEFLVCLLTGLHECLNKGSGKPSTPLSEDTVKSKVVWRNYLKQEDSKLVSLFVGQLRSTLICARCSHTSATFEPVWDLSLPIPKSTCNSEVITIEQCLNAYFNDERIDGVFCSRCKKHQSCRKQVSIHKFPSILIIHLKRFTDDQKKLNTMVVFPVDDLDLSLFMSAEVVSARYKLYAVVNHFGSLSSGHYTACCLHPFTNRWYCFNDQHVFDLDSGSSVVTDKAYILFYQHEIHSSKL